MEVGSLSKFLPFDKSIDVAVVIAQSFAQSFPDMPFRSILEQSAIATCAIVDIPKAMATAASCIIQTFPEFPRKRGDEQLSASILHYILISAKQLQEIPSALAERAQFLLGRLVFESQDALDVIPYLAQTGRAIHLGDAWNRPADNLSIGWLGQSDYVCDEKQLTWEAYVQCCAAGMTAFVTAWKDLPKAEPTNLVFWLRWSTQAESNSDWV